MLGNFNEEAQFIILKATEEMKSLNHPYIGTEHLLLSILKNENNLSKRLSDFGITYDTFKSEILSVIGKGTKKPEFILYTPLLKKIIENALLDSKDNNNGEVTPAHLISSLLEEGEGIAIRILIGMDIDIDDLYDEFLIKLTPKKKRRKRKLITEELGINLTETATKKKLDPVIGREEELQRLIEILCRRTKNNPLLIGDAGVGKTAIVEELSKRISDNNIPRKLKNKKIISLDMASLVAGTKYRGEFEERMHKIIKEVSEEEDIILFIDEIHTLVGAGGAEGAIDASNILKPALSRGSIHLIGATTKEEYKKYIEKEKALDRRFQKLIIEEPTEEKTIQILEKLSPIYEEYHQVTIPKFILTLIVKLSNKYITNRKNPDKSIDILDEASAMISIKTTKEEQQITTLLQKLSEIKKNKNAYILENNMEKAYYYLKEESKINNQINDLQKNKQKNVKKITKEDIAIIIHSKTKIPVYEIMNEDLININNMKQELENTIIGQQKAINKLMEITKKIKLGYSNNKVKSLLFLGPTGVGKTELSKIFTKYLVGEKNLIRLDMSEYSSSISVSKIIGSSPGYVGYEENNTVLSLIKDKPASVILLDEIDKACPEVLNLLYQMLDEGKIKDAKNNEIILNNNIIIMTSNIGFEETTVGFNQNQTTKINTAIKKYFSDALINRIDEIITFDKLTKENITVIINKRLQKLSEKYQDLKINKSIIDEIIELSKYETYGARKVDKLINSKLESIILDKIIKKEELEITSIKECYI